MSNVPTPREIVMDDLVHAGHILSSEGLLDSFGHVSARDPDHPDRFVIARVKAAELVTRSDLVTLDLDGRPTTPTDDRLFAERYLHAEVYRSRPDVMSVCHHHAPSILPFCVTGIALVPVVHLGATMGAQVPFWDSQDEFGDTNLIVSTPAQGASMARALGPHWTCLLRRHGATVAGRSIRECVFRAIYGAHNAEVQRQVMAMGAWQPLPAEESRLTGDFNLTPIAVDRAWEHWVRSAETSRSGPSA